MLQWTSSLSSSQMVQTLSMSSHKEERFNLQVVHLVLAICLLLQKLMMGRANMFDSVYWHLLAMLQVKLLCIIGASGCTKTTVM